MIVWLLVLLLLFVLIYVVYRINLDDHSNDLKKDGKRHYTFKI